LFIIEARARHVIIALTITIKTTRQSLEIVELETTMNATRHHQTGRRRMA